MENQLMDEMASVMNAIWNEEAKLSDLQEEMKEREIIKSDLRKELEALALAYYSQGQTEAVANKKLRQHDKVKLIKIRDNDQERRLGKIATITAIDESWMYPYSLHFDGEKVESTNLYERDQLEKLEVR